MFPHSSQNPLSDVGTWKLWSCLFNNWMFLWLKLAVCLGTLVQFTDLTVQDFWVMKSFRLDGRSHWQCRTVPEGFRVAVSQPKAFPLQLVRERIRFLLRTGRSWLKLVLPVAVQLRLWHHQAGVVFGAAMFDTCSEKKSLDGTRWDDVLPAGLHLHRHGGPINLWTHLKNPVSDKLFGCNHFSRTLLRWRC